jgi:hypothetical protein
VQFWRDEIAHRRAERQGAKIAGMTRAMLMLTVVVAVCTVVVAVCTVVLVFRG